MLFDPAKLWLVSLINGNRRGLPVFSFYNQQNSHDWENTSDIFSIEKHYWPTKLKENQKDKINESQIAVSFLLNKKKTKITIRYNLTCQQNHEEDRKPAQQELWEASTVTWRRLHTVWFKPPETTETFVSYSVQSYSLLRRCAVHLWLLF